MKKRNDARISIGLTLLAAAVFGQAIPAYAQEQAFVFDIPAQDLGAALQAFARLTNSQLSFEKNSVAGKRTRSLQGSYSAQAGLDMLLSGSGLCAERGRSGIFLILTTKGATLPLGSSAQPAPGEPSTSPVATADADGDEGPGEIVVTAQKREQSLIDVPVAITALSSAKIAQQNFQSMASISTLVPNFNVTYERGTNAAPYLILRGVGGDGAGSRINESSVAMYADEVYLSDETMLTGSIFDLERIEVLRGPQGTLFGRNTTGGLAHFISATPTKTMSGYGSAIYGSDNWVSLEGAIGGPVADRVRVRLAGKYDRHDGHYDNLLDIDQVTPGRQRPAGVSAKVGAREVWGLRGTVDVDLSESVLLRVIGSHQESDSQVPGGRAPGTLDPADPTGRTFCSLDRILDGECVSLSQLRFGQPANGGRSPGKAVTNLTDDQIAIRQFTNSITARLTADMDWATLTSVTNYADNEFRQGIDADAGPDPVGRAFDVRAQYDNKAWQFSQELRLNNSTGPFDWVTGTYFYTDSKESQIYTEVVSARAPANFSNTRVDTVSGAVFAQIDAYLSDEWTLSVGERYTIETRKLKRAIATIAGFGSEDVQAQLADASPVTKNLTGKLSLAWKPSADYAFYAAYSRGAKSPGFNGNFSGSPANFGGGNARLAGPVGEEKLDAFELGAKTRLFDRKLSINSAVFYYDFSGKQAVLSRLVDGIPRGEFLNVGSVRLYGAEIEVAFAPNDYWDLSATGGWLKNKITDSDLVLLDPVGVATKLQGLSLPRTPEWNASAILAYHIPTEKSGRFTLQAEANAQASQNFAITDFYLARDESRVVANFRLLWRSENRNLNAEAFVTNAFDRNYFLNALDAPIGPRGGGFIAATENEGRLWGVKLGTRF